MLPDLTYELDALEQRGLRRTLRTVEPSGGPVLAIEGRECLLFCSNSYLGLSGHESLRKATLASIDTFGGGSEASALICGHTSTHQKAHRAVADLIGKEAAVSFPSGYAANLGTVATLIGRGDVVFSDALNHRSLIDACRLSRADVEVYNHGDTAHLEDLLTAHRTARRRLIATDGVFSMDGDLAPLPELADLAEREDAILVVDDAHATGVFGKGGGGTPEHFGLTDRVDVVTTSASKALGSFGGYSVSRREVIDLIVNRAGPYIFTSALPPESCAATSVAVQLLRKDPGHGGRLLHTARHLRDRLAQLGFDTLGSESQIIPILIGDPSRTMESADLLLDRGIFLLGIRPPTVPEGTSRLRLSLMANHTEEHIDQLVEALVEVKRELVF